jgi:hypothetical protein
MTDAQMIPRDSNFFKGSLQRCRCNSNTIHCPETEQEKSYFGNHYFCWGNMTHVTAPFGND